MTYNPKNIFARIIAGDIPCNKVYEDASVLAFHDISPKAKVHVLLIPKAPYQDFSDFTKRASLEEIAHFFKVAADLAQILEVEAPGFRVLTNKGADAGQEVPHFHVHLLGGQRLPIL